MRKTNITQLPTVAYGRIAMKNTRHRETRFLKARPILKSIGKFVISLLNLTCLNHSILLPFAMILRREKSSPIYPQAPLSVILTDLSALHAWHHATPGISAQIDELQRIAEARTGRSSVMAQGVLCFFNLCAEYFYETYGDPADQMRSIMLTPSADEGNSSVTVSPNPTDGALRIESDNILSIVEIYDSFGKLMLTEQCNGPFCLLDISTLNAGMYLLKVRLDNGTETNCKVMKK